MAKQNQNPTPKNNPAGYERAKGDVPRMRNPPPPPPPPPVIKKG